MRNLIWLAALPLCACSASGSTGAPASGSGTIRTYAISDFTSVELAGSDNVAVRIGSGFSVRAEGSAKALDRLKIERSGDTLEIGHKKNMNFDWGGNRDSARIYVTMPRITAAKISGSGDMSVDRVEGNAFDASSAGSGNITIAKMAVPSTRLSIAGSGSITAAGAATDLSISIAGSGDVEGAALAASRADVSVAGSGSVRAVVNGSARVSILGSGDVDLGSKATCTTSKMGSGTVNCGG